MYVLSFLFIVLLYSEPLDAQIFKKKKNKAKLEETKESAKEGKDTYTEKIKNTDVYEGLFPLYRDTEKGNVYIEITEDQLNKEYIHFSYIENGVTDAGFFRGNFRGSKVFKIQKYFNRIEFVQENTTYYFDQENALSKSAHANVNSPVLVSEAIVATSKDSSKFLLDADKIFLSEKY